MASVTFILPTQPFDNDILQTWQYRIADDVKLLECDRHGKTVVKIRVNVRGKRMSAEILDCCCSDFEMLLRENLSQITL